MYYTIISICVRYAPVDVLRESGESDARIVVVKHVNVRVEYERVARAPVLRQNCTIGHRYVTIQQVHYTCVALMSPLNSIHTGDGHS